MRFLFVVDSVESPLAVNPELGRRLAACLAELGHQVHLLELWDGQTPPPAPAGAGTPNGVVLHDLPFPDERLMNQALENGSRQGSPVPLRLARLAIHPSAVGAAFRQLVLHKPRRVEDTRREIERLDAIYHFDFVTAVAAPYRAAFALEQAGISGKKVLWLLDPYAANRSYQAPGGWARELQLLRAVDTAFVTRQALSDYQQGPLAPCRSKVFELAFPALVPPQAEVLDPHRGQGPIRCVFCGTLYPELRSPEFALELFRKLDDPDLTLTMVGRGWEHFSRQAEAARQALGNRVELSGPVRPAHARTLIGQADILLNLGNTVDNQIPSKLFEYFGTGKPILHLAASRGDAALPYLERYPLALVLQQAEGSGADVVARLAGWLHQNAGKALSFAQAEAIFPEFTPEAVARRFVEVASR
ncbi:glycosyltransferase [uncultured Gemmiger sp.]|uniref:glycosyltransferase n=1 Tax=uncultured Gemmiger sp. TaxID=1623490 RepID=UPI0025D554F3|nr:glycosyltransferase [uncultured Gemmiger sp.]